LFPTPEFRRGSTLGHDDWIAWSIRASDDSIAERAFSRKIGGEARGGSQSGGALTIRVT
jgi:hypothetical protein